MKVIDISGHDEEFTRLLNAESKQPVLELEAQGGWVKAKRQKPDFALTLSKLDMSKLSGLPVSAEKLVPLDHVWSILLRGEPLTVAGLLHGAIQLEKSGSLGVAFLVPANFWEHEILGRVAGLKIGSSVVAFCPELIRDAERAVSATIDWVHHTKRLRALQRYVIYHEFAHFFIDPALRIPDKRFHDAFANYLAYGSLGDKDSRDVVQVFSVSSQDSRYNYFLLLNNYDGTRQLLPSLLAGDVDHAVEGFYKAIVAQPLSETSDRRLRVLGDIVGWPGFGSTNVAIACAGELVGLANLRSGLIFSAKIKIVDGFFPAGVRIYANEVKKISRLAQRCGVVRVIPATQVDLGHLVALGLEFDELEAICEGRAQQPQSYTPRTTIYSVCIPCRCGVLIVTERTARSYAEVDTTVLMRARCDRCQLEVETHGGIVVLLSVNDRLDFDWQTGGGTPEIEKLLAMTEYWLKVNRPEVVLNRVPGHQMSGVRS